MTTPKISVIMAAYNGERYVRQAIDSILGQTYADFELILVEDGSTDSTRTIMSRCARQDARVVLVENGYNQGLVYSLNRGLGMARGAYIARMDADDVSLPERLARQVRYMDQHPEVGVLGTNIIHVDADGCIMHGGRPKDSRPLSPDLIKWMLLWRCPIYHPTVMARRAVFEQTGITYDPDFRHAEDYELWTQFSRYTAIASLPEVLVHYRILPTSVCRAFRQEQRAMIHSIIRRELTALLGAGISKEALETLIGVFSRHNHNADRDFVAALAILFEAYRRFCEQPLSEADREQIRADVADRLIAVAQEASKYSSTMALTVLWRLHHVPSMHLFSVKTSKRILKVLLNSFGIHRRARAGG
jgi:glycosyltransferase involved in cell wall biosynthesis